MLSLYSRKESISNNQTDANGQFSNPLGGVESRKEKKVGFASSLIGQLLGKDEDPKLPVARSGLVDLGRQVKITGGVDRYEELVSVENSGVIYKDRLIGLLQEIVLDAMRMGTRELYIGHPREYRYEFFVDDTGYQGAIQPSDYFGLLKLFSEESELQIPVDWEDVEVLSLSLTSNYLNPVIHVSWRYRWVEAEVQESLYSLVY